MIENMIYGLATVEIVERACTRGPNAPGTVIEPAYMNGLVWVRYEVSSFCKARGPYAGYVYDLKNGPSGWSHEENVRNFVRTV